MTNAEIIDSIKTNVSNLLNSSYKLLELKATERFVIVSSKFFLIILSCFVVSVMLILASIALSMYLGKVLENDVLGYLAVSSIYFVFFLFLIIFRKKLFFPFLRNIITRELYD